MTMAKAKLRRHTFDSVKYTVHVYDNVISKHVILQSYTYTLYMYYYLTAQGHGHGQDALWGHAHDAGLRGQAAELL